MTKEGVLPLKEKRESFSYCRPMDHLRDTNEIFQKSFPKKAGISSHQRAKDLFLKGSGLSSQVIKLSSLKENVKYFS